MPGLMNLDGGLIISRTPFTGKKSARLTFMVNLDVEVYQRQAEIKARQDYNIKQYQKKMREHQQLLLDATLQSMQMDKDLHYIPLFSNEDASANGVVTSPSPASLETRYAKLQLQATNDDELSGQQKTDSDSCRFSGRLDKLPPEVLANIVRQINPYDLGRSLASCAPLLRVFNACKQVFYDEMEDERFASMQNLYGSSRGRTYFQRLNMKAAVGSLEVFKRPPDWIGDGIDVDQRVAAILTDIEAGRIQGYMNLVVSQNIKDGAEYLQTRAEEDTGIKLSISAAACFANLLHTSPVIEYPGGLESPERFVSVLHRSLAERLDIIVAQSSSTKAELRQMLEHLMVQQVRFLDLLGFNVAEMMEETSKRWTTTVTDYLSAKDWVPKLACGYLIRCVLYRIIPCAAPNYKDWPGDVYWSFVDVLQESADDVFHYPLDSEPLARFEGCISLAEALHFDFDLMSNGSEFSRWIDDKIAAFEQEIEQTES